MKRRIITPQSKADAVRLRAEADEALHDLRIRFITETYQQQIEHGYDNIPRKEMVPPTINQFLSRGNFDYRYGDIVEHFAYRGMRLRVVNAQAHVQTTTREVPDYSRSYTNPKGKVITPMNIETIRMNVVLVQTVLADTNDVYRYHAAEHLIKAAHQN